MYFKILKKDLKRKKTMNLILLIFILLATMFVAGSLNMAVTVMNGTNYYFEEAGIGDYLILTMRGSVDADKSNEEAIAHFLQETSHVDQYSQGEQLFLTKKNILKPDNKRKKAENRRECQGCIFRAFHKIPKKPCKTGHFLALGGIL